MLKTKTITTDKATLLVCELPEGAKFIRIETNQAVVPYGQEVNYEVPATKESYGYEETEGFALPEGNWQLLGRLPDITEGYVYELIHEVITPIMGFKAYLNLDKDGYCKTALESLSSLLRSNDIYFDNPFGKEPDSRNEFYRDALGITSNYWSDLLEWQEAQSKVWDRERTYILTKVD